MKRTQWGIVLTAELNVILGIALDFGTFGPSSSVFTFFASLAGVSSFIIALGLIQHRASARFACLYRTLVFLMISLVQHHAGLFLLSLSTFIFLTTKPARNFFVPHATRAEPISDPTRQPTET